MSSMDYEINGRDDELTRGISRNFEEEFFIFEDEDDGIDAAPVEDRSSGSVLGSPNGEDRYDLSTQERDALSSSGSTNSDSEEEVDLRCDSVPEEPQCVTEGNTERL